MTLSRSLARPLMSSIFFVGPIGTWKNSAAVAKKAEKVTAPIARLAQRAGVPVRHDPELFVKVNAGVQLAGAAALATGRCPRAAAGVLALTLVPTTLAGHRFWEESDPAARAQQRLQFAKNLSLFGGLMVAALDTEGRPGKAWLVRQTAKQVGKRADHLATTARLEAKIAALEAAGAGDTLAETLTSAGHAAKERAHGLGDLISDKAPEWAAAAGTAGTVAAAKSQDLGSRLADKASEKAPEWAAAGRAVGEDALAKSQDLAGSLGDWSSQTARDVQKRTKPWGKQARARSQELAESLSQSLGDWSNETVDTLDKRTKPWRKEARARAKDARKNLRKELKSARKDARKQWAKQSKKARKNADAWKASAQREVAKAKSKAA